MATVCVPREEKYILCQRYVFPGRRNTYYGNGMCSPGGEIHAMATVGVPWEEKCILWQRYVFPGRRNTYYGNGICFSEDTWL
jgi:hypothetical protein